MNIAITPKQRRQAQRAVGEILKPTYFDVIPLQDIFAALKELGLIVVQEDGTPWEGMLCGDDSYANFEMYLGDVPVKNAALCLQWHRMSSGRTEVCGYVS